MNLFRSAVVAISLAWTASLGSASATTTSTLPPNLANSHTLDLRAASSQIVVDTIEHALRWGGFKLFDERFQLDSSLGWVFGETIEGEVDAVIPLWGKGKQAVFVQPGAVFWTGLEEAERIDGNFGVVYRAVMADDVIGGASVFYDHDFEIGHQRIGIGVDVQRSGFHGAFNYYHPISDTQDGREGYIEDALQGMDVSLAIESHLTRVGGNVGYWKFQGDEETRDEWKLSFGLDAGLRIIPGVFLEGSLQNHDDDVSLGRRASVGLAFRFSLPGLKGKSYGDSGRVLNLYKPVPREKRIIYEEREAVPKVRLSTPASQTGNTRNVAVRLDEVFAEDVVLNLVGTGSATYGTDGDWTISVGGEVCDTVAGTGCQVTVTAGQTAAADDVVITLAEPERGELSKDIILSVVVASTGVELAPGNPLVVRTPAGRPFPTVSLNYSGSATVQEGGDITMTITLSEPLTENVSFNFSLGENNEATYGISGDFLVRYDGGDNECSSAITQCTPVPPTITAGNTSKDITISILPDTAGVQTDTEAELVSISLGIANAGSTGLIPGGTTNQTFTIAENPPPPVITHTVSFPGSNSRDIIDEGMHGSSNATATLVISPAPTAMVDIPLTFTGNSAAYSFTLSGATSTGTPSSNDVVISVPANPGTITLTVTAERDGDTSDDDIEVSFGTLPDGYGPGTPSAWMIRVLDALPP
ncbi:MAG: inverse autotransporter beta domain-containing protein [Hyphomicrobiales bacterium]|nr:inverse autotransporter beta domain-containing protein [Hyphomicrobiales bacterium]